MISAYVEQIKPIPPRIVASVCTELNLEQQPFVLSPMALNGMNENDMSSSFADGINPAAESADSLEDSEL